MTLTQLEYIIAVDTYRHFVTAAEHCFVTQPSLSMQIQKLEDDLGLIIFDRSKQPIVPTTEGAIIIQQARIVLQEAKRLREMAKEQKNDLHGELHIGVIPTVSPYLIPLFLQSFLQNYPTIKIKISEIPTNEIIHRLKNETIDAGILATPLLENSIMEIPLFYEPFVAFFPDIHPFKNQKTIDQNDLKDMDILLLEEGHCLRTQMLQFCKPQSEKEKAHFIYEAGSIETLKNLVQRGMGITILPELSIMDLDEEKMEHVMYFNAPEPVREISLVHSRAQLKLKLIQCLEKEILASLPLKLKNNPKPNIISIY